MDLELIHFSWKEWLESEDNIALCLSIEAATWDATTPAMLLLVRGAPGAGKSSLAQHISKVYGFKHHEADHFMLKNGFYHFDSRRLGWAHEQCREVTRQDLFINGENVVVSNTFSHEKEITPYRKMGVDAHYVVKEITLHNDFGSVHNVPRNTIEKMQRRLAKK